MFRFGLIALATVLTVSAAGAETRSTRSPCPSPSRIYVIGADASGLRSLTTNTFTPYRSPAWSHDGKSIAFEREGAILVMSADGGSPTRVATNTVPHRDPTWSPDGTKIAYTGGIWPRRDIVVTQLATGVQKYLTNGSADNIQPSWSPDGTKIAFVSSRAGSFDIFVMNADGSTQADLTQSPAVDDTAPAWSPDGTRIAYASGNSESSDILVMYADGSEPRNLTQSSRANGEPAWSPNGTKIAFVQSSESNKPYYPDIVVMNADGTGQALLVARRAPYDGPTWSPDGTRIAFAEDHGAQVFGLGIRPCVVPWVLRLRLDVARARIRNSFCRTGPIRYTRSSRPRGSVISQYPHPRAVRAPFACVSPVVSRGRG